MDWDYLPSCTFSGGILQLFKASSVFVHPLRSCAYMIHPQTDGRTGWFLYSPKQLYLQGGRLNNESLILKYMCLLIYFVKTCGNSEIKLQQLWIYKYRSECNSMWLDAWKCMWMQQGLILNLMAVLTLCLSSLYISTAENNVKNLSKQKAGETMWEKRN